MGKAIVYSEGELHWIEKHGTLPRRQAYELFIAKYQRTDISLQNFTSLCKRNGWLTGRTGCFEKGSVPANKGMKMPYNANSARTQFKKGQLPHNTKSAGHENITKDGYIEFSVNEKNPHTGFERRFMLKHKYLWEKENGPVPEGHCLKCLDGNKLNTDPSNWKCIPRAVLPRLSGRYGRGFETAPAKQRPTIMAISELEHAQKEAAGRLKDLKNG